MLKMEQSCKNMEVSLKRVTRFGCKKRKQGYAISNLYTKNGLKLEFLAKQEPPLAPLLTKEGMGEVVADKL